MTTKKDDEPWRISVYIPLSEQLVRSWLSAEVTQGMSMSEAFMVLARREASKNQDAQSILLQHRIEQLEKDVRYLMDRQSNTQGALLSTASEATVLPDNTEVMPDLSKTNLDEF